MTFLWNRISILEFAIEKTVANKVDMKEDLLAAATRAVESTPPARKSTNESFVKAFSSFLFLFLMLNSVVSMKCLETN